MDSKLEKTNFEFLTAKPETEEWYQKAQSVERNYLIGDYATEIQVMRPIIESMTRLIAEIEGVTNYEMNTFARNLGAVKHNAEMPKFIVNYLYELKDLGNQSSHTTDSFNQATGYSVLFKLYGVLVWFMESYTGTKVKREFSEPVLTENLYNTVAERKLIYVQSVPESDDFRGYIGTEKVGETSVPVNEVEINQEPNSDDLRRIADKCVTTYMGRSNLPYQVDWTEMAYRKSDRTWFHDHDVHRVLQRSGINQKTVNGSKGTEWYETDVETVKKAIKAVKEGRSSIYDDEQVKPASITLRPEQQAAINKAKSVFKTKNKMLWNAKMRFGKTLSALQLVKDEKFNKVLILTHRPVVSDSWFEDFRKMRMQDESYHYGSKTKGETLNELTVGTDPYIYFASMQDLRGSEAVGGKQGEKNELVFNNDWDLVIVDEAHEGTQTDLASNVIEGVTGKNTKILELSGTPFNILDQFDQDDVYTWDYSMEQQAKERWYLERPDEPNPYEQLPKVSMFTCEMKNKESFEDGNKAFNFKEFFRVNDEGTFVYEDKINEFLNELTRPSKDTNYPYSTKQYRDELRHTLWLLPGVKEAGALKELMQKHPVFGMEYDIINIVDDGDSEIASQNDVDRVRSVIGDDPSSTKTITLTVRKLTTGVNVPEWTAVMFLSNTNSATQYLQAAFRAQTPYSDENGMKENAYIFDFAPDRALTVMAASANLNSDAGKRNTSEQKEALTKLLNFLPILGTDGNGMQEYSVDALLKQVKRVFAEKAVQSGFDDDSLYSDELLMNLDDADLNEFNNLKAIVGTTKSEKKPFKIDVNNQGLSEEEYDLGSKAEKKSKKNRTPEEMEALDKLKEKRKESKAMISVLRGISIRIPMMIYGMEVDLDEDVDIDSFVKNVDDKSWKEFMPEGVTKGLFAKFKKYYDPEIFIEAGRIIRNHVKNLDTLDPIERAEELAVVFSTFKNPDKETVLTPWRVVNMQLANTLGGLSFYDDKFEAVTTNGIHNNHWVNTDITDETFKPNTKFLEINSKTGLYPLYVATSLYKLGVDTLNDTNAGRFTSKDCDALWEKILKENIFVIAKTPMAATITRRTLVGYKRAELNIRYISGIIDNLRDTNESTVENVEKEFNDMHFDVVIGNPPYQESDNSSGNGSAKPLYHHFVELAKSLNPKYISLITPSVWFTGGKGLDGFREEMLADEHIESIHNFTTPKDVFPTTNLRGGVSYFLWSKDFNNKQNGVDITTITDGKVIESGTRPMTLPKLDILISSNESFNLIKRLISNGYINLDSDSGQMLQKYVSSRNPFGFATTFVKNGNFKSSPKGLSVPVKIYASGSKIGYVERSLIKKHVDWIDRKKVLTPFANNIGTDLADDNLNIVFSEENSIATETYLVIGGDLNLQDYQVDNLAKYLQTKFVRFLISLAKANQNGTRGTYRFVPMQDFTNESDIKWNESSENIDLQLAKKYDLSEDETEHINSLIQKMESGNV